MFNEIVGYLKEKGFSSLTLDMSAERVSLSVRPGDLHAMAETADEAMAEIEAKAIESAEARKVKLEVELAQVNAIIAAKPSK